MNEKEKQIFSKQLAFAFMSYGRELSYETLQFMISKLLDMSFESLMNALDGYCKDPKSNMPPTVGALRMRCNSRADDRTLAIEASSRVIQAVTKFGWNNIPGAKEFIGSLGWRAVERSGGWLYICENLGVALTVGTFQAQIRDICEAQMKLADHGVFEAPALPECKRGGGLQSAGEIIKQLSANQRGENEEDKK